MARKSFSKTVNFARLSFGAFWLLLVFVMPCFSQDEETYDEPTVEEQLAIADKDFLYDDALINPLGIKLFLSWMSDNGPSGTTTINLEGVGRHTNQFSAKYAKDKNGWVSVGKQDEDAAKGWFSYRHLGRLANGCHVLETQLNEGGSGIFKNLLLVRFSIHKEYKKDGEFSKYLVLTRVGEFALGDRYNGKITVKPSEIVIGDDKGFHHDQAGRTISFK
ncbi:MAG TPA: hypothetical protein PLP17_06195 [Oligoflexia bacterium]|nr:hypothetical protein [Oligoflexia bacterium]